MFFNKRNTSENFEKQNTPTLPDIIRRAIEAIDAQLSAIDEKMRELNDLRERGNCVKAEREALLEECKGIIESYKNGELGSNEAKCKLYSIRTQIADRESMILKIDRHHYSAYGAASGLAYSYRELKEVLVLLLDDVLNRYNFAYVQLSDEEGERKDALSDLLLRAIQIIERGVASSFDIDPITASLKALLG